MSMLAIFGAVALLVLYFWYWHLGDLPELYRWMRDVGVRWPIAVAVTIAVLVAGFVFLEML